MCDLFARINIATSQMTGLDIATYLDRDDSLVSFGAWRSAMPKLSASPPV